MPDARELERGVEWEDPEEGHFCGSIVRNANGGHTGHGSICGTVTIDGETYEWSKSVSFRLRKSKPAK